MSYAAFLKALLALGPKLPQVFALVQHIVEDVRALAELIGGSPSVFGAASLELSDEEMADESEVLSAIGGMEEGSFGAIGDGKIIRSIFAFLQANPDLLKAILTLLKL